MVLFLCVNEYIQGDPMSLLVAQAQAVSQPSRHGAVWSGTRGLVYLDSNTLCIPRRKQGGPIREPYFGYNRDREIALSPRVFCRKKGLSVKQSLRFLKLKFNS